MSTQSLPYAHLGEALATDYFHVREQFTDEQWEHFLATRRFVDEEVLPAINEYWEAAELPWPLMRRLAELGLVRRGHRGLRLPGHEPARPRPREHGAAPRRRQPRHVPRRPVRAGDEVDRPARLRGAEGALAAGDGPARRDRRVRADRARARLGLGRARDDARAATATAGSSTAPSAGSATARSPTSSSSGRAPTRTARSRASSSRPTRRATTRRRSTGKGASRAIWQADIRLDGVRVPEASRLPGRETVQGRRPRARHDAHDVRLGRARPRGRGLRRGAHLQQAAHAVRQAAVQLPDRPGPARQDARRGHRHAALLHAARPPGAGRAA